MSDQANQANRQALFGMAVDWETRTVLIHLPPVPAQGGMFMLGPDEAEEIFKQGLGLVAQIRGVAKAQGPTS